MLSSKLPLGGRWSAGQLAQGTGFNIRSGRDRPSVIWNQSLMLNKLLARGFVIVLLQQFIQIVRQRRIIANSAGVTMAMTG